MKKILLLFLLGTNFMLAQNELKHDVFFETDKYKVTETEQNRLILFIQEIQKVDLQKISIFGFCDDRGTNSYNLTLSQNRADAIKALFSEYEIDNTLINNVDGKGEVLLIIVDKKNTSIVRSLNRKVEIIATYKPEEIKEKEIKEVEKPKEAEDVLKGDLEIGDKVILKNILFKTGYSSVLPESEETLAKIAKILKDRKDIYFTIQGHVCCTQFARDAVDRKTKKRNLSVARAKYIYYYLSDKGVDKNRMKYEGLRRKFPLGGEAKFDRRVEIVITNIIQDKK